jgi:hypothetical protein
MGENRIVIRGSYVISMDEKLGNLPGGRRARRGAADCRSRSSVELSDARVIDARGAVVIPGLIDTHRHTWQTQMRAICADWTLGDSFQVRFAAAAGIRPIAPSSQMVNRERFSERARNFAHQPSQPDVTRVVV